MGHLEWINAKGVERLFGVTPEIIKYWVEEKILPPECWQSSATGVQIFFNLKEMEKRVRELKTRGRSQLTRSLQTHFDEV